MSPEKRCPPHCLACPCRATSGTGPGSSSCFRRASQTAGRAPEGQEGQQRRATAGSGWLFALVSCIKAYYIAC